MQKEEEHISRLSDPVVTHKDKITKMPETKTIRDDTIDLNVHRIKSLTDKPKKPLVPIRYKRKTNYLVIAVLFTLSIIALIAILNYQPKINLIVTPEASKIRLDGKKINPEHKTSAGKHIITVSHEGYKTYEKTVTLKPWQKYRKEIALVAIGQPRLISQKDALSISVDQNENRYFYLRSDGKVIYMVRQLADSQKTIEERAITPELEPIEKVIFSPDFSLAIMKFKSGEIGVYDFNQYDLINQEYTPWDKNIKEIIWRPDGEKLLYQKNTDSGDNALFVNNRLREKEERILDLRGEGLENPQFFWSQDGKKVLIIGQTNLYLYAYTDKKLSYIAQEGVTSAQIMPDSSTIIFTQSGSLKRVKIDLISAFEKNVNSENIGRVNILEEISDLKVNLESSRLVYLPSTTYALYYDNLAINKINLLNGDVTTLYKNSNGQKIVDLIIDPAQKSVVYLTEENKIYQIEYKN